MSDLAQTLTHEADGVARLLERFRGMPVFEALLRIALKRTQHVEDVLWSIYVGVWIDNAVGVQLDNLGDVVGEPRGGRQDTQYRIYIRARIAINRANGKINDTLKVARLILESTATLTYTPEYPAAYRVDVANTAISAADIDVLLNQVRPAGVRLTTVVAGDLTLALIWDDVGAAHIWDAGQWSDSI